MNRCDPCGAIITNGLVNIKETRKRYVILGAVMLSAMQYAILMTETRTYSRQGSHICTTCCAPGQSSCCVKIQVLILLEIIVNQPSLFSSTHIPH